MRRTVDVSIVIPAYNAAAFLGGTLAMLREQTVSPREIIVVDDASTDATVQVARAAGVRVLSVTHGGPAQARNRGVEASTSDWIAFLDADDVWHPRKLEIQCDVIERVPGLALLAADYDQISSSRMLVPDSVVRLDRYRALAPVRLEGQAVLCESALLAALLPVWCIILTSTVIVNRDAFLRAGGFNGELMAEDVDLFLRLLRFGRAAFVELPLVGYLRHPTQMTALRSQDEVVLELCRHVLRHATHYLPESVRASRSRVFHLSVRALARHAAALDVSGFAATASRALALRPTTGDVLDVLNRLAARISSTVNPKSQEPIPDQRGFGATVPWRRS